MSTRVAALVALLVISVALAGWRLTQPIPVEQSHQPEIVLCRQLPVSERFERADLVVTGSVFAVVPGQGGLADVLITPSEILKGIPPVTGIVLAARPTTAVAAATPRNDLHFTSSDQPYFLVLYSRDDGRFDTSACDGSRLLGGGVTPQERHAIGQ